ncbi:MAG: TolC family protein [Gemmatimonadota bacterium]
MLIPRQRLLRLAGDLMLLLAMLIVATHVQAQALSLSDAMRRADEYAFANIAARGSDLAQRADATRALRGILPTLRADAGYLRTTDPVAVFGTTLRQRSITAQDFDPARLNFPSPAPNYTAALVLEQPLFNADALLGRNAAGSLSRASAADSRWTAIDTRVEIVRAYYGAILAGHEVATLDAALRAAREHVRQAEALVKNGLVTPADALLASVKAGEVETALIEARGRAATAHAGLAVALGTPSDTTIALPLRLPSNDVITTLAHASRSATTLRERDDVVAAQLRSKAAQQDAARAKSLYLPRINSFARYDWNAANQPFTGTKNWTVGVMASWTPFAGAYELAELQATGGRRQAADAAREGAQARADLELAKSAVELDVGLARLAIAQRSQQQSADAHRIVARKYAGGIASIVELLDAAAAETASRLGEAAARYALINAVATRQRAIGADLSAMSALDNAAVASQPNPNEP